MGRRKAGRPKDMPTAFRHGTRARYNTGCRCRPCTHANLALYHDREARAKQAAMLEAGPARTATHCVGVKGEPCPHNTRLRKDSTGNICMRCRKKLVWNGLVPAKAARHHLKILSGRGIGYKAVADAACISTSVMFKIVSGKRKNIRVSTEIKILEVDNGARFDNSYVDARPTHRMIAKLINDHGYTKTSLAKLLGSKSKTPAIQLHRDRVTVRNAAKVKKVFDDAEGNNLGR